MNSVGRGCPAASNFLLLRQKKSKQKKRRPWCLRPFASLRATCGARFRRGLAKLAPFHSAQTTRSLVRLNLRSSAHAQGDPEYQQPNSRRQNSEYLKPQGHATACPCWYLSSWYFGIRFPIPIAPSWLGRGAQTEADQGSRCLSAVKRSEFSETPPESSTTGCP